MSDFVDDAVKIAVISPGNEDIAYAWIAQLLQTLGRQRRLELALFHRGADRAALAAALVLRIAQLSDASVTVLGTDQLAKALDGASFVVWKEPFGGTDDAMRDVGIARSHGVVQTVGDTLGPGGVFRTLRMVPAALSLVEAIGRYCPEAWLLTRTDPLCAISTAITRATGYRRAIGLSNAVRDTHAFLADLVGREVTEVSFLTAGLPHQAFVLRFEAEGRDLYDELTEALRSSPWRHDRVRVELFRRFGYFPTESSEHNAEYLPWFLHSPQERQRLRLDPDFAMQQAARYRLDYEMFHHRATTDSVLLAPWGPGQIVAEAIEALTGWAPREMNATVPNTGGALAGYPETVGVEVPVMLSEHSMVPAQVPEMPQPLLAVNRSFMSVVELAVEAALSGSAQTVRQALYLDPNTAASLTLQQIDALARAMFEDQRPFLPPAFAGAVEEGGFRAL